MRVPGQSIFCLCLFLKLSLFTAPTHAQQPADSVAAGLSGQFPENHMLTTVGPDSRLYNGWEYLRNGTPAKGSTIEIGAPVRAFVSPLKLPVRIVAGGTIVY